MGERKSRQPPRQGGASAHLGRQHRRENDLSGNSRGLVCRTPSTTAGEPPPADRV